MYQTELNILALQVINYDPAIMAGASLSVTNITTITDVASTTGDAVSYSGSAITTGNVMHVTGSGATAQTGSAVVSADGGVNTVGACLEAISTGAYTGVGVADGIINCTGNSLTTGYLANFQATSLTSGRAININVPALTSGAAIRITGGGVNQLVGADLLRIDCGASTTGCAIEINCTGAYTNTTESLLTVNATSLTTGNASYWTLSGLTSGIALKIQTAVATMTTGRFVSFNDGATEVFGIGLNGHIISTVSASLPTIAVTTQAGITAAAITAGGSDTCGIITTTGTSTGSTVLDVTFGKTYTTAPKAVILVPANAAAAMPNTGYFVSAVSATGFTITVAAGGTYAATPSFRYLVIA